MYTSKNEACPLVLPWLDDFRAWALVNMTKFTGTKRRSATDVKRLATDCPLFIRRREVP